MIDRETWALRGYSIASQPPQRRNHNSNMLSLTLSMSTLYVVTWGYFSDNCPIIGDNSLPTYTTIIIKEKVFSCLCWKT